MSQNKVLDAVKVTFLLIIISGSFYFVGESILNQNIVAGNKSQEAAVVSSLNEEREEPGARNLLYKCNSEHFCDADYNNDGLLNKDDLQILQNHISLLNSGQTGNPMVNEGETADINGIEGVTLQDLDILEAIIYGDPIPFTGELPCECFTGLDYEAVYGPDHPCLHLQLDDENADLYNASGAGTSDNPFRIYNHKQLRSMGNDINALDDDYRQCKDISFAGTYSATKPYFTIGSSLVPFTGSYDGNNHSIANFEYRQGGPFFKDPTNGIFDVNGNLIRNTTSRVGLFGSLYGATIKNLTIVFPKIIVENDYVGSLAGFASDSTITDFFLTNYTSSPNVFSVIQGKSSVGGVIGQIHGSHLTRIQGAKTKVFGGFYVGGIVGIMGFSSLEKGSNLGGDIRLGLSPYPWTENFGGLVGYVAASTINESYSNARVAVVANKVGGLVGGMNGSDTDTIISNSHATGEVVGEDAVGGFIGHMSGGEIKDSYAKGNVQSRFSTGGFVGKKGGGGLANIYRSYSTGKVTGLSPAGGFVGALQFNSEGTISDSYTTGKVSGLIAGGFIGASYASNGHTIINSYSSGNVGGPLGFTGIGGTISIGGFIGRIEDELSYLNLVTTSNVIGVSGIPQFPGSVDYGKFKGSQGLPLPQQQFNKSYYFEGAQCPPGCNTVGISIPNLATFQGNGLSLPPFNWTFDNSTWKAVPGGLPILPNAGAN